jgi:hypothetical protein
MDNKYLDDAIYYLYLVLEQQEKAVKDAINKSSIFTSSGKYKKITRKQIEEYTEQHNALETCDYPESYRDLCPAHNSKNNNNRY